MSSSTRPVRASRLKAKPTSDLPFPEGPADPQNTLHTLISSLNVGIYSPAQLGRVDDFVVRALFERKSNWRKPRRTDTLKFCLDSFIPPSLAKAVANAWQRSCLTPLNEWEDLASTVWSEQIQPLLERGEPTGGLLEEDSTCFKKYVMRIW